MIPMTTLDPAPAVDVAAIDALRPGDVVTLRRYRPADGDGPARLYVGQLTIAKLQRLDDWDGEPNWCLEGRESEMRGVWAVGKVPCGMVTTLELVV